jgi:hypothetical protein
MKSAAPEGNAAAIGRISVSSLRGESTILSAVTPPDLLKMSWSVRRRAETVLAKEFATVWGRGERADFGVLKKRSFLVEDASRCVTAGAWYESSARRVEN